VACSCKWQKLQVKSSWNQRGKDTENKDLETLEMTDLKIESRTQMTEKRFFLQKIFTDCKAKVEEVNNSHFALFILKL